MIQFNLLPNVKLEYVKARRTEYLLTVISVAVSGVAVLVFISAFLTVHVVQTKSLNDENRDIAKYSNQLQSVKDLDKILTVQDQLGTLTALHDQKPAATRLFTYLTQVTPDQASLNKLTVDFGAHTMTIGGTAPSLDAVSTYTDTLKTTSYVTGKLQDWKSGHDYKQGDNVMSNGVAYTARVDHKSGNSSQPGGNGSWQGDWQAAPTAFSKVVLATFGRDNTGATFTISLNFDPTIFNSSKNVNLAVKTDTNIAQQNVFGAGN